MLPHDQNHPPFFAKMPVEGPVLVSYTQLRVCALQDMLGMRSGMCLPGRCHPKPPEATWRLFSGTRLRSLMMSPGIRCA